jgi:hypothetical protein
VEASRHGVSAMPWPSTDGEMMEMKIMMLMVVVRES